MNLENKLKDDIDDLKVQIDNEKGTYRQEIRLLKIKKMLMLLKLSIPYSVSLGVTGLICGVNGHIPFVQDKTKIYAYQKHTIDSNDNERIESQYCEYRDEHNTVTYVGKWQKDNRGKYYRIKKVFTVDNFDDMLLNLVKEDASLQDIEKFTKDEGLERREETSNLTMDEYNAKPYITATIYDRSKDEYRVVKESATVNGFLTVLWLAFNSYLLFFVNGSRQTYRKYSDEIYENNSEIRKFQLLKSKLMIKKDTYERIKR